MDKFEFCVIGAGAIGLAIARAITLSGCVDPEKVVVIEAQPAYGEGISSRSSEVIHGGLYYPPKSLKAKLCIEGKALLYDFLQVNDIPHRRCGKLILAQDGQEEALESLLLNAQQSGVGGLSLLSGDLLKQKEPQLKARSALLSPSTGIIDSHHYMYALVSHVQAQGAVCAFNSHVKEINFCGDGHRVRISAGNGTKTNFSEFTFETSNLINCAGLQATAVAKRIKQLDPKLIPRTWLCKGDYFAYHGKNPFNHLIYPIPEPNTVGLGIHSTMDLQNQLRFGPDAYYVDEENYDVDLNKGPDFAASVRRYFPAIDVSKLQPAYSGIRPKLSGPGEAARDFVFQTQAQHNVKGLINLFGIESPGLTASLAIAQYTNQLIGLN